MKVYWRVYSSSYLLIAETNDPRRLRYFVTRSSVPVHGPECGCGIPAYIIGYPGGNILTVDEWLARVS